MCLHEPPRVYETLQELSELISVDKGRLLLLGGWFTVLKKATVSLRQQSRSDTAARFDKETSCYAEAS